MGVGGSSGDAWHLQSYHLNASNWRISSPHGCIRAVGHVGSVAGHSDVWTILQHLSGACRSRHSAPASRKVELHCLTPSTHTSFAGKQRMASFTSLLMHIATLIQPIMKLAPSSATFGQESRASEQQPGGGKTGDHLMQAAAGPKPHGGMICKLAFM